MTGSASKPTDPALYDPKTLAGELRRARAGTLLGLPLRYLDETTSTNDEALEWSALGAPEGTMVIAGSQTAGRGRLGHEWLSRPGQGLWFSLILRPDLAYPASGMLPLAIGFGAALALGRLGLDASLKWPNDLLVRGRKVGGILVEGRAEGGRLSVAVAGIGVNWRLPDDEELAKRATGLEAEFGTRALSGEHPPPVMVLAAILDGVERAYLLLKAAGPAPFRVTWPRLSAHFGRLAEIIDLATQVPEEVLAGGIGEDGTLEVVTMGGQRKRLASAEVGLVLETNLRSPA